MAILLGLGYLLSENEKATTLLKNQLAQEAQLAQEKIRQGTNHSDYSPMATSAADTKLAPKVINTEIMKSFENTLINNLTCVTLAQCQVVTIQFKNISCKLASNIIGASQLKKIATQTITMNTCPSVNPPSQLACQQNICTLINTSK
tara:strand:+ start:662 stop:1102 length:441 start_codon:yes stop_codon:yes gene_type:complete